MEKINLAYRRKDDLLEGVMLVKTVAARKSSNGGLYLDLTVMDATGGGDRLGGPRAHRAARPAGDV